MERSVRIVLIADDDATTRMLAREALEPCGLRVEEAENGAQALELYRSLRPDIVLMDVMMPEMNGFEACAALRRTPDGDRTPVLFMTGLEDRDSIARAYDAGATDFVTKPWDALILSQRVRYMLRAGGTLEALHENQARLAQAQRIARLGSWEWDLDTDVLRGSSEFHSILGRKPSHSPRMYKELRDIVHVEDKDLLDQALRDAISKKRPCDIEYRLLHGDGRERVVQTQAEVVTDGEGRPIRLIGTLHDVTDRKQQEAQIKFLAYYDNLTLLPNRRLFQDRLAQMLAGCTRFGESAAVLLINLDRFQRINESLGHQAGDRLLHQVSERLRHAVRNSDSIGRLTQPQDDEKVSRFGGDTFAVLATRIQTADKAAKVAERVLASFVAPFSLDTQKIVLTGSIGICLLPHDGKEVDSVLKHAEVALRHAKARGRNTYQFYTPAMNVAASERLALENALQWALERDQLELHFQPVVSMRGAHITGAEALLRWHHPEEGMVPPAAFIPIAEESGLMTIIGEWVLRTACRQQRAWRDAGLPAIRMSVNLSALQFRQPNLVDIVLRALHDNRMEGRDLELELTEGTLMEDVGLTVSTLQALKEAGVTVAIDDFGTGYSSLSYLQRFPIDTVKIDRSFLEDLSPHSGEAAIIKAIVGMAKALKLRVVAEGAETEQQLNLLRTHGCDEVQGYVIARPVPGPSFAELFRRDAQRHVQPCSA